MVGLHDDPHAQNASVHDTTKTNYVGYFNESCTSCSLYLGLLVMIKIKGLIVFLGFRIQKIHDTLFLLKQ